MIELPETPEDLSDLELQEKEEKKIQSYEDEITRNNLNALP